MSYLPTQESILLGLRACVDSSPRDFLSSEVYPKFKNLCEQNDLKPPKLDQVRRIINEETKRPSYEQLRLLIQAFGIDNWPWFLDLCDPCDTSDIVVVGPENHESRTIKSIQPAEKNKVIRIDCVMPKTLGKIRTRIDRVVMKKGHKTEFAPHYGHEFVHVFSGVVDFYFEESPDEQLTSPVRLYGSGEMVRRANGHPEKAPYAVAFPARVSHSFECISDEAKIFIGRGAKSLPKGVENS